MRLVSEFASNKGGTSNVSFGYRVVAKRKDVVAKRLARVRLPDVGSKRPLPGLRLKLAGF